MTLHHAGDGPSVLIGSDVVEIPAVVGAHFPIGARKIGSAESYFLSRRHGREEMEQPHSPLPSFEHSTDLPCEAFQLA